MNISRDTKHLRSNEGETQKYGVEGNIGKFTHKASMTQTRQPKGQALNRRNVEKE
jgi:hypothetical protein